MPLFQGVKPLHFLLDLVPKFKQFPIWLESGRIGQILLVHFNLILSLLILITVVLLTSCIFACLAQVLIKCGLYVETIKLIDLAIELLQLLILKEY